MRTRHSILVARLVGMALIAGATFASDPGWGDEVEIIRPSRGTSENFTFAILLHTNTNAWVTLEVSSDLRIWSERANIASGDDAVAFVDEKSENWTNRFYRIRIPGTTPQDAADRWNQGGIQDYRFRIRRPFLYRTATVEVKGGTKIVRDVRDAITSEPVSEFDPSDFPSIEELFAELGAVLGPELLDSRMTYDQEYGFPTYVAIRAGGRLVGYELWDFQALSEP